MKTEMMKPDELEPLDLTTVEFKNTFNRITHNDAT